MILSTSYYFEFKNSCHNLKCQSCETLIGSALETILSFFFFKTKEFSFFLGKYVDISLVVIVSLRTVCFK